MPRFFRSSLCLRVCVTAGLIAAVACQRTDRDLVVDRSRAIELRNAEGGLVYSLRPTRAGLRWIDFALGLSGRLDWKAGGLAVVDGPGAPGEARVRSADELELVSAAGATLRLERRDGLLRVGDGAGIPRGRVRTQKDEAVLHDPAGMIVAMARQAGGRIVVAKRDGATLGFVIGPAKLELAALAFLPGVSPLERAVLLAIPYGAPGPKS